MDIFHIILTFNLGDYCNYCTTYLKKFHVIVEEILVHFKKHIVIFFVNNKILSFETSFYVIVLILEQFAFSRIVIDQI